jgi:hypothetical protein
MLDGGLINNNWFVSMATLAIALVVSPLIAAFGTWFRARRGPLTGTYLALSDSEEPGQMLVETVRLSQVGVRVKGQIRARAYISVDESGDLGSLEPAEGSFRFEGRVAGRQVLIAYWDSAKASQNGGNITSVIGSPGSWAAGRWVGLKNEEELTSGQCLWVCIEAKKLLSCDPGELTAGIDALLNVIPNAWRSPEQRHVRQLAYRPSMMKLAYFYSRSPSMLFTLGMTRFQSGAARVEESIKQTHDPGMDPDQVV